MTDIEQLVCKIAELDAALEADNPGMSGYLKDIHTSLSTQPELLHLLKPEERAVIIRGLEVKIGATIVTPARKTAAAKPPKGVNLVDFL